MMLSKERFDFKNRSVAGILRVCMKARGVILSFCCHFLWVTQLLLAHSLWFCWKQFHFLLT